MAGFFARELHYIKHRETSWYIKFPLIAAGFGIGFGLASFIPPIAISALALKVTTGLIGAAVFPPTVAGVIRCCMNKPVSREEQEPTILNDEIVMKELAREKKERGRRVEDNISNIRDMPSKRISRRNSFSASEGSSSYARERSQEVAGTKDYEFHSMKQHLPTRKEIINRSIFHGGSSLPSVKKNHDLPNERNKRKRRSTYFTLGTKIAIDRMKQVEGFTPDEDLVKTLRKIAPGTVEFEAGEAASLLKESGYDSDISDISDLSINSLDMSDSSGDESEGEDEVLFERSNTSKFKKKKLI